MQGCIYNSALNLVGFLANGISGQTGWADHWGRKVITMNAGNSMKTMTGLGLWFARAGATALATLAGAASAAINDLPGGPSVLQLNLPPAVTKIAQEQHWLHCS